MKIIETIERHTRWAGIPWIERKRWRLWLFIVGCTVIVLWSLSGCALPPAGFTTFADSEAVSYRYDAWFGDRIDVDKQAADHCAQYHKTAVFVSEDPPATEARTRTYHCVLP